MQDLTNLTFTDDERPPSSRPPPRRRPWILLSVCLLLLGGIASGAYLLLRDEPVFTLEQASLGGVNRFTIDEALALAGLSRGMNLLDVDEAESAQRLLALPFVRRASVTRELPRSVRIEVGERNAAVRVALGALYVADEEGAVFRRARPDEP